MEILPYKLMKKDKIFSGITLAFLLFSPLKATASSFNDFVFFGDSITDSGNVFFATGGETTETPFGGIAPSRPYASKNFSNDLVWTQYLASLNNSNSEAYLNPTTSGNNFAFGGATNQPLDGVASPSLEEQLDLWQLNTGNTADPNALYFVQGGGNNIRIATALEDSLQTAFLQNAANSIETIVSELIDAGATNIAVINAPDIGLTPEATLGGFSEEATNLSLDYNSFLEQTLTFNSEEVNLINVDLFGFINSITNDPTAFNLPANTVTNLPCILPDSVCSNPNEYIFYDGIHPTSAVQLQFANFVNEQISRPSTSVPEPSIFMGLSSVLILARKKRFF